MVNAAIIAAATSSTVPASTVTASTGWKWAAVGIGLFRPPAEVTIQGSYLGIGGVGSALSMDQRTIPTTNWTDTTMTFDVPQPRTGGTGWPNAITDTQLTVTVGNQTSNAIRLQVQGP